MVLPNQIHHTSCSAALANNRKFRHRQTWNKQDLSKKITTCTHQQLTAAETTYKLSDTIQGLIQEHEQARAGIDSLRSQTDKLQQQLLQQTQPTDPFPSFNQQPPCRNLEATTQMSNIESAS
ncbi:hypothetical protein G6F43_004813 [Rhizopus delemar]|nr:hypothetical protein G6F43_004813 [Rhizopus delemar]